MPPLESLPVHPGRRILLVALHGVAMKIKDVLGCTYPVGLFGRDMGSQLL